MAGNSSIFYLRKEINDSNIKQWQSWSYDINYVVEQFNDVVQTLNDHITQSEITIHALQEKIDKLIAKSGTNMPYYVKIDLNEIEIPSSKNQTYVRSVGLFSNPKQSNNIYVYSLKKVGGLYINDIPITQSSVEKIGTLWYASPIGQFSGSESGITLSIKSDNVEKMGNDIELYFSICNKIATSDALYVSSDETPTFKKFPDGEHIINAPDLNLNDYKNFLNDFSNMKIKIKRSGVVKKQIIALDKSALSKTLINSTVMSTKAIEVDKQIDSLTVGKYSFIKTAAEVAKNKINRKK